MIRANAMSARLHIVFGVRMIGRSLGAIVVFTAMYPKMGNASGTQDKPINLVRSILK